MNIGYVYDFSTYPVRGGGGVHVSNLIAQFVQQSCCVHAFAPETNPACEIYPQTADGVRSLVSNVDVLYVRIDARPLPRRPSCLSAINLALQNGTPVFWEINAPANETLTHAHMVRLKGPANRRKSNLLSHLRRTASAFKSHARMWWNVRREDHLRSMLGPRLTGAICVSDPLVRYANDLGIRNVTTIPNGSDPVRFNPQLRREGFYDLPKGAYSLVYAGDIRYPWQGFDIVQHLAEHSLKSAPNLHFIVISHAAFDAKSSLPNVHYLTNISYDEIPAYLANADCCLCLYSTDYMKPYGFHNSSLKLFDYMACGRPVIATNVGQIPQIIHHRKNGLLTSNAIDDLLTQILYLEQHPSKAALIGQRAREDIIECYNWSSIASSTVEFFTAGNAQTRSYPLQKRA